MSRNTGSRDPRAGGSTSATPRAATASREDGRQLRRAAGHDEPVARQSPAARRRASPPRRHDDREPLVRDDDARAASGNDRTTKTLPVQLAQQYGSKNGSLNSAEHREDAAADVRRDDHRPCGKRGQSAGGVGEHHVGEKREDEAGGDHADAADQQRTLRPSHPDRREPDKSREHGQDAEPLRSGPSEVTRPAARGRSRGDRQRGRKTRSPGVRRRPARTVRDCERRRCGRGHRQPEAHPGRGVHLADGCGTPRFRIEVIVGPSGLPHLRASHSPTSRSPRCRAVSRF